MYFSINDGNPWYSLDWISSKLLIWSFILAEKLSLELWSSIWIAFLISSSSPSSFSQSFKVDSLILNKLFSSSILSINEDAVARMAPTFSVSESQSFTRRFSSRIQIYSLIIFLYHSLMVLLWRIYSFNLTYTWSKHSKKTLNLFSLKNSGKTLMENELMGLKVASWLRLVLKIYWVWSNL